jgi:hypothetical protein
MTDDTDFDQILVVLKSGYGVCEMQRRRSLEKAIPAPQHLCYSRLDLTLRMR